MDFTFAIPSDLFPYLKKHLSFYKLFGRKSISLKNPADLPKKIYIFWDQGIDNAPELVKYCVQSWSKMNPDWEVVVLDKNAADKICDRSDYPPEMRVAHYSDILRAKLLEENGGIWVDATCLCMRPLDEWIGPIFCQTNFFAFSHPGPDRIISIWFLASTAKNSMLTGWVRLLQKFWSKPRRFAPYFSTHYLFERQIRSNRLSANIWSETPKFSATAPHLMKRLLANDAELTPSAMQILKVTPVQKLSHKKGVPVSRIKKIVNAI